MSSSKIQPAKPFVVLLYGFPGAGKTAFARQLSEEINMAHLQQDRLSHELYGGNNEQASVSARQAMNYMMGEFLHANVAVIYDADVHRLSDRRALRDEARHFKAIPVLIWFQIDPESAFVRTQSRDRRKSDDKYSKDYTQDEYESILGRMQNPGNEDYVVVSGKHTFNSQRTAVMKKLYELGLLTPNQLSQNVAKPELVNLVPKTLGGRADLSRRNINIR